jgi:hypothetical protein
MDDLDSFKASLHRICRAAPPLNIILIMVCCKEGGRDSGYWQIRGIKPCANSEFDAEFTYGCH